MQPQPLPSSVDLPQVPPEQPRKMARSTLVSRNVTIAGHRTSVRLEPEMWSGLSEICRRERASLHEVCTAVSMHKAGNTSLTAAIRVFVMAYYRAAASEEGHVKAGHGYGMAMGIASVPVSQTMPPAAPVTRAPAPSPFVIGASWSSGLKSRMR